MVWLWSALAVIILAAIITLISSSSSRASWTVIQSESGTRVDLVDRTYAYLKSQGIKPRVEGDDRLRQLLVRKRDEDRARSLVQSFNSKT